MILLEWFTNSCKYGAHSVASGRLRVRWELIDAQTGKRLRLRWTETGITEMPKSMAPSLGTNLVNGFATRELGGRCEMSFPAGGADHLLEFSPEVTQENRVKDDRGP